MHLARMHVCMQRLVPGTGLWAARCTHFVLDVGVWGVKPELSYAVCLPQSASSALVVVVVAVVVVVRGEDGLNACTDCTRVRYLCRIGAYCMQQPLWSGSGASLACFHFIARPAAAETESSAYPSTYTCSTGTAESFPATSLGIDT